MDVCSQAAPDDALLAAAEVMPGPSLERLVQRAFCRKPLLRLTFFVAAP
jgi:hypothetical protein